MIRKKILASLLIVISTYVFAGVNPKNGNFWVTYTDIVIKPQKSGFNNISRTYNSKASEIGIFGYGWGSLIETRLFAYPDGTLMVKENGTGMDVYYTSVYATDDMLELMIDQLIEASIISGALKNTPSEILGQRHTYRNNQEIRNRDWTKYTKKDILKRETDFPVDMEWESNQLGNERIVKTFSGYRRVGNKVVEDFDDNGNLTRYDKGNGYYTSIEYVGNRISKMINADGSELIFANNSDGFVTSIFIGEGKGSFYVYNGNDLIETTDNAGNVFRHTYNEKHDMLSIKYVDDTSQIMTYLPKTGKISSKTDRYGEKIEYDYLVFYNDDGSINKNHFGTKITKNYHDSSSTKIYEYKIGTRVDGNRFNKMLKTVINGVKRETHYDELCGSPISIEYDNIKTTFKYNNRCLLIEKLSAYGDSISLEYHSSFDKITKVTRNGIISEFDYNEKGLLNYAKNMNTKKWVKLVYDESGNIVKMIQKKKEFSFKYNNLNKPSEVTINGKGVVYYTYNANGEIINKESKGKKNLSLEVDKGYQTLFELTEPAKVDFEL